MAAGTNYAAANWPSSSAAPAAAAAAVGAPSSSSSAAAASAASLLNFPVPGYPPRKVVSWRYNPYRTAQVYKDLRDWMFLAYQSCPQVYLHLTTCLKFLAADYASVARIHAALEQWQVINVPGKVQPESRPTIGVDIHATIAPTTMTTQQHPQEYNPQQQQGQR
jgi:hypothetical protein